MSAIWCAAPHGVGDLLPIPEREVLYPQSRTPRGANEVRSVTSRPVSAEEQGRFII